MFKSDLSKVCLGIAFVFVLALGALFIDRQKHACPDLSIYVYCTN